MTNGFTRLRISLAGTMILATILTSVGQAWPTSATGQKTAKVAGTIFDLLGAVVVNAKVAVRAPSFEKETATNGAGRYEIELPAGIYSIEVASAGFCRARRASFNARPEFTVRFDFTLLVCPSHGEGLMSYESFALKSRSSEPLDFLIRFVKRTDQQEMIEFEGALTEIAYYNSDTKVTDRRQTYVKVAATYDGWTISANHLTLNKRTLRLELSGDVAILDGVQDTKAERAEVDFALPIPLVNVKN